MIENKTKSFIEKANRIHNNKFDYSMVNYINNYTTVKISCPIHGKFAKTPNAHLRSFGCPKCGIEKRNKSHRNTKSEFINKSNNIHKNKYNYTKSDYIKNNIKIEIICPNHGSFFQSPQHHMSGKGCYICSKEKLSNLFRCDRDEFIHRVNKIHGNKYDYSNIRYNNLHEKIKIECPTHGSFFQMAQNHLKGKGCPKCNFSHGEMKIFQYLKNNKIQHISQKTFDDCRNPRTNALLKYDFYIPSKNLLIEYDGEQHFKKILIVGKHLMSNGDLKYIKFKDKIKTKYAKNNGIKLLRICYKKLNIINNVLKPIL